MRQVPLHPRSIKRKKENGGYENEIRENILIMTDFMCILKEIHYM